MEFEASIDYLSGSKALLLESDRTPVNSSTPLVKETGSSTIVSWGDSNTHPQDVIAQAATSPELLSLIDFLCTVLYGGGLYYEVHGDKDAKGRPTWVEGYDEEVEAWMQKNAINDYLLESVIDFVWFNICFPELIKNKKGDKIAQITHQESAFCRFGKQNTSGINDTVYINANQPAKAEDELTIPVVAIDPYDLNKVTTVSNLKVFKFIYPFSYPTPGKIVYPAPAWQSIYSSGWLDIAKAVPILKKALMKHQMIIRYVIKVPQNFWEVKAKEIKKEWSALSKAEKKTLKDEVKKEMDKFLTGEENAGKSFMTTIGWDSITKTEIPGVSIAQMDDKLQDGKYIEDSKEASGQTIRAFGIPLPLIGPISSGDMGGGSGSDARIHMNILNNRLKSRRDKILSPLSFIAEYNGWRTRIPGFRWKIREFTIDTLDVNHATSNPKPAI